MNEMTLMELLGPVEPLTPKAVHSPKAILCGGDDLLTQSVRLFLNQMKWDVVLVSRDDDAERLVQEIKCARPEVVILCQNKPEEITLPWQLIDANLCQRVFTIGLDSNIMHSYSKQDILLRGASDLMSIINPGNFSNCIHENKEATPDNTNQ